MYDVMIEITLMAFIILLGMYLSFKVAFWCVLRIIELNQKIIADMMAEKEKEEEFLKEEIRRSLKI
jgi:hypothetical protein